MDRKKTIVAAVMINAGILTVLFIAAMTMKDDPVQVAEARKPTAQFDEPKPLFKEPLELPTPVPLARETAIPAPLPPVAFALPPVAVEEPTPVPIPVAAAPAPAPAIPSPAAPAANEIEVQKGDSLERLAKRHHTTVDEIIQLNQLPSSFLRVGQKLKMPAEKIHEAPKAKLAAAPEPQSQAAEYYTMKVGDNPWSIAMKHHMKVDELLKLNGLNDKSARKLKPGDRLRIK